MSHDLFALLHTRLPVGPSIALPDGHRSRGWTLRPDRLHARAVRFDWLHGPRTDASTPEDRAALRHDVLAAATRIATEAGYRVTTDGTGLLLVTPAPHTQPH